MYVYLEYVICHAQCTNQIIYIFLLKYRQQSFFTRTYRELKRLDSVTRSPIYALLGETLDGVLTIRAFNAEKSLSNRMVSMLDIQQTAYHLTFASQCWLSIRLEFAGYVLCMMWRSVLCLLLYVTLTSSSHPIYILS